MGGRLTRYTALFCTIVLLASVGGVWAVWKYIDFPATTLDDGVSIGLNEFVYDEHPMPDGEVSLLQRMHDLLNNLYTNDLIDAINAENGYTTSRECLLTTLDKNWDVGGADILNPSFVGSMDRGEDSQARIRAMFGDVIDFDDPNHVSFILKSENLIGDWQNEIALYSTSDVLDWWYIPEPRAEHYGYVGVYLSVFIPVFDADGHVSGYELVCDSIHGYCQEVNYLNDGTITPSFTTNSWVDQMFYWHYAYADPQPLTGEDRYKYEYYHVLQYPYEGCPWPGYIDPDVKGLTASQRLQQILASQS